MQGLSAGQPIYSVKDLRRRFGDREILKGATFSLYPGDRVGVVGVNGAGKSTMMRILAGSDTEYEGSIIPAKGLTVGYVPQEPDLDLELTVEENVMLAVKETLDLLKRRDEIYELYAEPEYAEGEKLEQLLKEQGEVESALESKGVNDEAEVMNKIDQAWDALNLPPRDRPAKVCSGGEKRADAWCRIRLGLRVGVTGGLVRHGLRLPSE